MKPHDHRWIAVNDDSGFWYEDGALTLVESCEEHESRYVGTDSRGESYHETIDSCRTERRHRFDVTRIEWTDGSQTLADQQRCLVAEQQSNALHEHYDAHPRLVEEVDCALAERLTEGSDPAALRFYSRFGVDDSDQTITVTVGCTDYHVTLSRTEVTIDEDGY